MRHPLCDVDPAHAAELDAFLYQHSGDYSSCLTSGTAVKPVSGPLDPFHLLHCNKERLVVPHDDFNLGVVNGRGHFNVLRSLHQSI